MTDDEQNDQVYETPEGITIYPPAGEGKPWRAVWTNPDGERRHKQAKERDILLGKLVPIAARLRADAHHTERPVSELVAAYLDQSRFTGRRGPWAQSYLEDQTRLCGYILAAVGTLKCEQVKIVHLQQLVDAQDTFGPGSRLSRTVNAVMKLGFARGFHTNPRLGMIAWQANGRTIPARKAKKAGEAQSFVDPRTLPGHRDVALLAGATQRKWNRKWWHELLIYTAAYTGMRNGELRALRAEWVDLRQRSIEVKEKAIEGAGGQRVEPPKGGKERTTIFPEVTPSGYRLADALAKRAAEAYAEQAAGRNPRALMFPNTRGGYSRRGPQDDGILGPAYLAAGWRDQHGNGLWTMHTLRHVFCTTALNDWKLQVPDVSVLAGHASTQITLQRYVSATAGTLGRAFALTGDGGATPVDQLAAMGAFLAPGRPVEVERTVDAEGWADVAGSPVNVGQRWAGRTVVLRLDGTNMYGVADSALIGTWPCPVPALELVDLDGAMPAMATLPSPLGAEGHIRVQRKVNRDGKVSIEARRIAVGRQHRGKHATVIVNDDNVQVIIDGEPALTAPRATDDPHPNLRVTRAELDAARRSRP